MPANDDYDEFLAWREWRSARGSEPPKTERRIGEMYEDWLPTVARASRDLRWSQGHYLERPFRYRGAEVTISQLRPSECTKDVLTQWIASLTEIIARGTDRPISPSTVDGARMALQSMFTHYVRTGEVRQNPLRGIPRDKKRHREREGYLTLEETEAHAGVMPLIGGYILRHCFATGCRQSNIRELRKQDIDWQLRQLKLTIKGGGQQRVAVPVKILEEMRQLCAVSTSDMVYPNPRNPRKPVPRATLCDWMDKACKSLRCSPKHVVHETRHGQALAFLGTPGATLTMLQKRLGHATIEQTARYARVRDRMLDLLAEIAEKTVSQTPGPDKT